MTRRGGLALVVALVLAGIPAGPGAAQEPGADGSDAPDWARRWSPLRSIAALPGSLPGVREILSDPVLWGAPRVGVFWTAGNPGALPFELEDRLASFSSASTEADGGYRRPLDPARVESLEGRAFGWKPFGATGAAIGGASVMRTTAYGALSDFDRPYHGSPYVVLDTAGSDLGRTESVLEGAAGWRIGPVGVGLAVGYRAQKTQTIEAPVPRILSAADPGAAAGLVWQVSPALRLGLHGRWRAHAERVLLVSVAAPSRIYLLQGYTEPPPQDLVGSHYTRRLDRDGLAFGLSAGGRAAGTDWAAFVESGSQEERQHSRSENDPPVDSWTTDGLTVGAGLQRPLGPAADLTLAGRYSTLAGEAARADLPDTVTFVADDVAAHGSAELRFRGIAAVALIGRLDVRYEDHSRSDQIEGVRLESSSWNTSAGVLAVWTPHPALEAFGGAGIVRYGAGGSMPDPTEIGPAFERFVAPDLALMISDAEGYAASAGLIWHGLPGGFVSARGSWQSVSPVAESTVAGLQPDGTRSVWAVELGLGYRAGPTR